MIAALGSFRFGEPWFLALAALVPAALILGARLGRRPRVLFPARALAAGLPVGPRVRLRAVPAFLQGLGLFGFALALARPLAGREEVTLQSEGIDIVLVVDRSGSMRFEDMAEGKSRLAVVKEVVADFARGRKADRMALVSFARYADLRCPFTLDADALLAFLKDVDVVRVREEDATAIGTGLARAVEILRGSTAKSRVAILLTDGENNVEDILPKEAAAFAKASGIRVYTIGAGRFVYQFDPFRGAIVASDQELDTTDLEEIAETTGGKFFRAQDETKLGKVYEEIDRLEKTRIEDRRYTEYTDLYALALIPGLLLYLSGAFLRLSLLRTLP